MSWAQQRAALLGKPVPVPDPCVISGCTDQIAAGDLVYCGPHRTKADDGSLWLRCCFCPATATPNDPIACSEHRALMDADDAQGEGAGG